MFTKKELQSIRELILRTDIKGSEAVQVVLLMNKIEILLKEPEKEETKLEKPKFEEIKHGTDTSKN